MINHYTNENSSFELYPEPSILYVAFVYSITIPLFIITTIGNGLILITIKFQARLLSSTSNYFILSLAFADFFVGIAIMPIMIVYTANKQIWTYSHIVCDSWMAFDFLCSSASFLTLSAMSIERYKMLTTSYVQIKHSSKFRIIVFICLSWLLPFLTWIPIIVLFRIKNGISSPNDCSLPAQKYLVLALCILLYHIPLLCMVVFYTKLIVHIKKSSDNNLVSSENLAFTSSNNQNNTNASNRANFQNNYYYSNNYLSNQNENNSIMYIYDKNSGKNMRKFSMNILASESCKIEEINKIKKSNSINFIQIKSSKNEKKYSSSIISKLPQCCIQKLTIKNTKKSIGLQHQHFLCNRSSSNNSVFNIKSLKNNNNKNNINPTNRSQSLVQCLVKKNTYTFSVANNYNLKLSKSAGFGSMCVQNSDQCLNSRKSSLASRTDYEIESENSLYAKYKLHTNASLNNFIDNQNLILNKEYSNEMLNNKEKRFSVFTSSSKKKDSYRVYDNANYQNLRLKRNRKAARMLGLLVAAFSICWLPYTIVYPLSQFYPNLLPGWSTVIIWWMGYLNSTINPFLYVYSNKNIRRSVRILFLKRWWNNCTGNRVNKSFRSDSLKQKIMLPSNKHVNNKNEKFNFI